MSPTTVSKYKGPINRGLWRLPVVCNINFTQSRTMKIFLSTNTFYRLTTNIVHAPMNDEFKLRKASEK